MAGKSPYSTLVDPASGQITHKECSKCDRMLTLNLYGKQKNGRFGLSSSCKECQRDRSEARRLHLRTVAPTLVNHKLCRDCGISKPATDFYHNSHTSDRLDSYCILCRSERGKRSHQTNSTSRGRRTKRRVLEVSTFLEVVDLFLLIEQQDGQCHYCLKDLDLFHDGNEYNPDAPHLEHVNPLSKGGEHSYANCVVACARCNLSKGAKDIQEWIELLHFRTLDAA